MSLKLPPVIVVAITALLMWLIDKYQSLEFISFNTPRWSIILTAILGIACIVLGGYSVFCKKDDRKSS